MPQTKAARYRKIMVGLAQAAKLHHAANLARQFMAALAGARIPYEVGRARSGRSVYVVVGPNRYRFSDHPPAHFKNNSRKRSTIHVETAAELADILDSLLQGRDPVPFKELAWQAGRGTADRLISSAKECREVWNQAHHKATPSMGEVRAALDRHQGIVSAMRKLLDNPS